MVLLAIITSSLRKKARRYRQPYKERKMKLFEQSVQEKGDSSVETVVRGNTEFALALYQKLRTVEGNLFFSPYSISTALAMTYAGARGNTETQMAQALHFLLDQEQLYPAFALLEARLSDIGRKGHIQLEVANQAGRHVDIHGNG
jgi:serpin B